MGWSSVGRVCPVFSSLACPQSFDPYSSFLTTAVQQEVLHLKDQISHQSRSNFKLEKDLRFLDSKIALLIAHKITAEVSGGDGIVQRSSGKTV